MFLLCRKVEEYSSAKSQNPDSALWLTYHVNTTARDVSVEVQSVPRTFKAFQALSAGKTLAMAIELERGTASLFVCVHCGAAVWGDGRASRAPVKGEREEYGYIGCSSSTDLHSTNRLPLLHSPSSPRST